MPMTKIFHNPRCSKSRQTLQLLKDKDLEPEIVEYLKMPPSAKEVSDILDLLGLEPRELMRRKEGAYKEYNLANEGLTRDQLIQSMVDNPVLIERPIVIHDGRAVIGRPPENVLEIL